MGGEGSGGYGFRGHIPERDGIWSGLMLLEYMVTTGRRPSELMDRLFEAVGPHYYNRRDVSFDPGDRPALLGRLESTEVAEMAGLRVTGGDSVDGRRFIFESNAWLLARFSGTEPLLRIYAEADSPEVVEQLLDGAQVFLGV